MKDDNELVKELQRNNANNEAFRMLLDKYHDKVYWYIRKIVISHDDSKDVLQNTFVRIYRNIGGFKGKSSLSTWIYKIAYNESLRFLSKDRLKLNSLDGEGNKYLEILINDEYFDGELLHIRLHEVISGLTEKQRSVFQMKYFDGLSFRQIEEITGVNENTLRSSYYSAVKIIEKNILEIKI